jgi:Beta propeller domain
MKQSCFALLLLLTACSRATPGGAPPQGTVPPPQASSLRTDGAAQAAGDPALAALAETRLTPSNCDAHANDAETEIRTMGAQLDAEYTRWREAQADCRANPQQAQRKFDEANAIFGDSVGSSFGAAGLGVRDGRGSGPGLGQGPDALGRGVRAETARSVSQSNNQVAGVDEADIVKTDGHHVYVVSNGAFRIIEALKPKIVSTTKLTGIARELLIVDDRAIVFTSSSEGRARCKYAYDCQIAGDGSSTRIDTFDISDRANPKALRTIELSGSLLASRRIGATVHTVVSESNTARSVYETWPAKLDLCGVPESTARAKFDALREENTRILRAHAFLPTLKERGATTTLCANLLESPIEGSDAFTSLLSFDARDPAAPVATSTLGSRPGVVFASETALYIASHRRKPKTGKWYSLYSDAAEVTELHKFRIGSAPTDTRYVGSGLVPGHALNQFAMDEWHGNVRIATTLGKVPNPATESFVSILKEGADGNLGRVGALSHLARGEDLRAIRFDEDRAYLVTFKKTDPLFSLNLADAAHPTVMGELKIPGFSTYLHRIDADHLLSIGFDTQDHNSFASFDGVMLQLFDVSKPTEPKLLHKEKIGTRGSSSEAGSDHLSFNYFADKGLLALPMTICEGHGADRDALRFAGLLVYRVGVEKGFERLGSIAHTKIGSSCSAWWSKATSEVKRSIFVDDLIYSVALDRIKVQRMNALGLDIADLSLR